MGSYGEEEVERVAFTYEQLRGGQSVLCMQTGNGKGANQKGMTPMGSIRNTHLVDKDLGFLAPDMRGNQFLRAQTGNAKGHSQKGMRGMGMARNQVALVQLKPEWKTKEAKILARKSEGVNPKLSGDYNMANQSSCGVAIGSRRNTTMGKNEVPLDPRSAGAMPFQSGTNKLASQRGMQNPPGIGAYRPQTGGINYKMEEDDMRKATEFTPWYSGLSKFASQKESGGFGKVRDVCPHVKCTKVFDSDTKLQACDGIVRLQMGNNRLATQHGLSMGGQRNQVNRSVWKQEWVDQLKAAEEQWAVEHPRWAEEKKENAPKPVLVKQKTEDNAEAEEEETVEAEETIEEEEENAEAEEESVAAEEEEKEETEEEKAGEEEENEEEEEEE